ncbi:hypothetical protein GWI33_009109 [Rhynchophorus ferrugineus]|uniref:Uncharacterized protein n=1 Tax=Rhynchophorus ferrugineus TaxID=354439 RepID=A0A834IH17_RHYFE|nr:hypothetical protein GWI33_009109 [Rhynchophorus ferrugineus]
MINKLVASSKTKDVKSKQNGDRHKSLSLAQPVICHRGRHAEHVDRHLFCADYLCISARRVRPNYAHFQTKLADISPKFFRPPVDDTSPNLRRAYIHKLAICLLGAGTPFGSCYDDGFARFSSVFCNWAISQSSTFINANKYLFVMAGPMD